MRLIKISGLLIFLAGFFIFNASFFWADYTLTRTIVDEKISDSTKRKLFLSESSSFLNQSVESNFEFVNKLSQAFEKINKKLVEDYRISNAEILELAEKSGPTFSISAADSVFRTSNESASFKNKVFREFGSHIDAKTFGDKEKLIEALRGVSDNIAGYGIVSGLT